MEYGKRSHYNAAQDLVRQGVWKIDPSQGLILGRGRSNSKWKPLGTSRRGYLRVRIGYKGPSVSAHRVIWEYVNGPSDLSLTINHKNGIKNDNRIDNLELITNRDNAIHAQKTGLYDHTTTKNQGAKNGMAKLDDDTVRQIKLLQKDGARGRDIAKMFNISEQCISQIKNGHIWSHLKI